MGKQPIPQDISTVLLACAELRLPITQTESEDLASVLLNLKSQLDMRQIYTDTVWSPAVLGQLRQAQFALALDLLTALSVSHGEVSQPLAVANRQMRQLYQALDWLQFPPSAHAQHRSVWSNLQGKLHRLGPRPARTNVRTYDRSKLCAALDQLKLPCKTMVPIQSYLADAVLEPQSSNAKAIILRLVSFSYMRNIPGRYGIKLHIAILFSRSSVLALASASLSTKAIAFGLSESLVLVSSQFYCSQTCICLCGLPQGTLYTPDVHMFIAG